MICRMCLVHCQEHIRIFDYEGLQLNIAAVIAKYFWFEPKVDDLVSNSVCKPCWAQISSFHSYYTHVEEAHRKLSETCFVKEEVTFDYESEEGRTENIQDKTSNDNARTVIQFGNGAKWSSVESQPFGQKEVVKQPVQNKNQTPGISLTCDEKRPGIVVEVKSRKKRKVGRPPKRRRQGIIGKSPGRPRKIISNAGERGTYEQNAIKPRRSVGRPRKITSNVGERETYKLNPIEPRRSRGRPKKIRSNVEEKETCEQNTIKPKRSVGRPRKSENLNKPDSKKSSGSDVENVILSDRLRRKAQVIDYCDKRKVIPKIVKPRTEKATEKSRRVDEHIAKYMKLKCQTCAAEFSAFSELKVHCRLSHKSSAFVVCCQKKFFQRVLLLEHINKHLNPDYFKCDLCGKTFADNQCLKGHTMLRHEPEELKVHKCDKCHRSYSKLYLLEKHKMIHIPVEEREYICVDCGKAFATKNYLSSHIRSVHENAYGIVCHICGKVIQGKTLLKKHQLEHAGIVEPKVQCNECGSWLKNKYSLKKHMDRHMERHEELKNPQQNICIICGKIAPSKAALRSHIKYVHISTRIHECTICMKSFKKALTLKEHMTTHTGEILYTCPYCPKTFNSSANMHSHKKKKHRADWEEDRKNKELERERFNNYQEENSGDFESSGQLPVEVVYDLTEVNLGNSADSVNIK